MARGADDRPRAKKRVEARRFISEDDVARIVALVRAWPALPLTWENIRARIGVEMFGHGDKRRRTDATVWSRQALSGNAGIKKAYTDRRAELLDAEKRGSRLRRRKRAPESVLLQQQVDHLRIENAELRAKLAAYEDLFRRYQLNRFQGATTDEQLLAPLAPKIERGGEKQ